MHPIKLKDGSFIVKKDAPEEMQELVLEALNKHFKATTVEKYEEATVGFLFHEGVRKFSRGNKKVSSRENHRIQKYMIGYMRAHYGPHVNVLQRKGRFLFNLTRVYKTDFGRLYSIDRIINLFVTSHALDRFEERTNGIGKDFEIESFKRRFKQKWNTEPTTYDLVDSLMDKVTQFGLSYNEDSVLINIGYGLFIAEIYVPFCVATTYLTPDMAYPKSDWFENKNMDMIDPKTLEEADPIDGPVFRARE